MATTPHIIVVGGGLAGLSAVIKIAKAGRHSEGARLQPCQGPKARNILA